MGCWVLATFGCGLSWGFGSLIAFRMLVGVGEASFVALASPFIGDTPQPAAWRARASLQPPPLPAQPVAILI
jgi:MFS family permease